MKPHPKDLGSKLTHAKITTDYSENLLEFITGVHSSTESLLNELTEIHNFARTSLVDEYLWPASLPGILPENEDDIPLAYYGESNVGKLKTLYRKGLGHRYGRSMQSIAGLHYNFSFSDRFWEYAHKEVNSNLSIQEFKNEQYFSLIRNYRRYSWLLIYLFGSSSVVHKSFLNRKEHQLEELSSDSFFTEFGTSLRMGGLGYTSDAQKDIGICYNQLSTYIKTLELARQENFKAYEKIGLKDSSGEYKQLNTNLLQIDNEFYSNIRPKNVAQSRESALQALHKRGIEYLEVRLLDLDPEEANGVSKKQIEFLHMFLIWCLVKDSPKICEKECREVDYNYAQVVASGRQENLSLIKNESKITLESYAKEIFEELRQTAELFSSIDLSYTESIAFYKNMSYLLQNL